ncbi:HIT family protein [Nonomuraea sp. NPDC048826]|uniref:HIT family protein n=1 Tax=Nonomuraea sp. NPDC048826 TaxID=3364347 RepID=UPI003711BE7B
MHALAVRYRRSHPRISMISRFAHIFRLISRKLRVATTVDKSWQDDCIFCLRHDPKLNRILCENTTFFARHDNYPAVAGHVEIVPKRHVASFFELTDHEILEAYALLREARSKLIKEYDTPDGYTIGVNEGKAAGQSIEHLHVHLIPRYFGDVKDPRGGIRQAAPNCEPDSWL